MGGFAWVTLATNDSYSLGALVLAHSLKQAGTAHQLAVLVTPGVTSAMREKLASVFNLVQEVNILDSKDEANLRLLKRPELGITFTKLHCWRLTQFDKCVFLDADTLVLQNSDELFEREELSAAPDVGWPDCFNSGVFVYRPSLDTYEKLIQFALEKGSFDGGDQGLLNLYFSDWAHKDISKHLPFIYNLCSTACYSYLPAFKQFGANAKIIHFIGTQKPWLQYFNTETKKVQPSGESSHLQEVLQLWWDIFCSLIHPHLSPAMAGLAGAFSQLTLGVARTAEQDALENVLRKQAWEVGNIDYLGKDSFANIWSKITETLSAAPSQPEASLPEEPQVPTPTVEPEVAPAASQSQTALQDVATSVLPSIPPIDDSPKIGSLESSPLQEPLISPSQTEPVLPQPSLEAVLADGTTGPTLVSAVTPVEEIKQPDPSVAIGKETESKAVPEAAEETLVVADADKTPLPKEEIISPEPIEPISAVQEPVLAPLPAAEPTVASSVVETPEIKDVPAPATVSTERDDTKPPIAPTSLIPQPTAAILSTEGPESIEASKSDLTATPEAAVPATEAPVITESSAASKADLTAAAPIGDSDAALTATVTAAVPAAEAPAPAELVTKPAVAVPESVEPAVASAAAALVPEQPTDTSLKGSPETKVVEATPPATPGTPPATPGTPPASPGAPPATPPVEKTKQALTAEASVPDTPPPSEGGSTPTPPPRKTDKPKKVAAKPKK